jgi:hypothetical protein
MRSLYFKILLASKNIIVVIIIIIINIIIIIIIIIIITEEEQKIYRPESSQVVPACPSTKSSLVAKQSPVEH